MRITRFMLSESVETCIKPKLKPYVVRTCLFFIDCKKREVYNGVKWQLHWNHYNNGFVCRNHYSKLVTNPKQTSEYKKKYNDKWNKIRGNKYDKIRNPKLLLYKNKQIALSFNPRKGYCSWCPNNIHDNSCTYTHMHHIEYYPIFVWFGTIEICNKCHSKESNIQRDSKTGKFIKTPRILLE